MYISLYNSYVVKKLLYYQTITIVIFCGLFCLVSVEWGVSAFVGGLVYLLPNGLFLWFSRFAKRKVEDDKPIRIAWCYALGEGTKVIATITLFIIALGLLKVAFIPLGSTYLSVLIVQIVAPSRDEKAVSIFNLKE